MDFRHCQTSALFGGFHNNAPPALEPGIQSRARDVDRGKARQQGDELIHAQLGPFLQHPFESVRFDQRGSKHKGALARLDLLEFFERTDMGIGTLVLDLPGKAEAFPIEQLDLLPRLESQDSAEVMSLIGRKDGDAVLDSILWNEKPPSGHGHPLPEDIFYLLEDVAFV